MPIARQIAEALEAAHEQGIIHRDPKPANIKVRPDGTVKVLDFGLAKLAAGSGQLAAGNASMSPTITSPALAGTMAGTLLGTASYISPEQAKGREADKRSDIWAFGCVLYEMLTGKQVFAGDSVTEVLARVLEREPDFALLPTTTPIAIRRLLRRCLEKDPKRRLDSAAAVRLEIDEASTSVAPAPPPARQLSVAWGLTAVAVVAAISLAAWTYFRDDPAPSQIARLEIVPSAERALWPSGSESRSFAISPDGTLVAYVGSATPTGERQLVVRRLDELEGSPLAGTTGARSPFFSPDGNWLAFFAGNEIKKVSMSGGPPVTVCRIIPRDDNSQASGRGGPDDTIAFSTTPNSGGLQSVPAAGGEPTTLATPDTGTVERGFMLPAPLPAAHAVLVTVKGFDGPPGDHVDVLDLDSGRRQTLIPHGSQAQYVDSRRLVDMAGGTLQAVRFDPERLEVSGDPVPIIRGAPSTGFSVSRSGTLAYVPGVASKARSPAGVVAGTRSLVWVDRQGRELSVGAPSRNYVVVRLSPDADRAAVEIRGTPNSIWLWDFARQVLSRLTAGTEDGSNPVWTRDGQRVAFLSIRTGSPLIFSQRADGTGAIDQLTKDGAAGNPKATAPDGKRLLSAGSGGVYLISLDRRSDAQLLLTSRALQNNPDISSDGRWLAYQSDESGVNEVYVRPFPNVNDGRWQVSTAGGVQPVWALSSGELFYLDGDGFLAAITVQASPTFSGGRPKRLFDTRYIGAPGTRTYDVSPDGQRFLMMKDVAAESTADTSANIVVVLNWLQELERLLPTQ